MKTTTRNVSIGGALALLWSMAVSWGGTNGYVQVWGTQDYGMQSVPSAALSNTTALAAGWYHCLALANGRVYAWGDGAGGQTNVADNAFAGVTAIAAGAKSSAAIKNGQIVLWGRADDDSKQADFAKIPANSPYISIALGANHGLAIRDNGSVDAWGDDNVGQVYQTAFWGVGIKAVAAGKEFSMGLNENGQVFVAGAPKNGDGDDLKIREIPPEATNGVSAIAAGPYHAMALKDGCVWVWGAWKDPAKHLARASYGGVTNVPASAKSGVVGIAAGFNTCAALKQDGSVVIWGNELGSGSIQLIPSCATKGVKEIVLGYRHAMARTSYLPPSLTSSALPPAYLESDYAGQITAIGDPMPTFYVKGLLKLPSGLALNPATGAITGVPEKLGTNHVTIAATNLYGEDARDFTIAVLPRKTSAPTWITESPLPQAVVGTWYEVQLEATENPVYSVDPALEPLPSWATLTSDGILKGWPKGVGIAYPTFIAANEVGSANRQLQLSTVNPTTVPVMAGQGALPDAVKGADYSVVLGIQGATNVVLSSGRLPAGLVLQGTNGTWKIAGIPTTTGDDQEFELTASNPIGPTNGTWSIAVKGPPEWVTPEGALPSGRAGVAYTATVEAKWATNYVASGSWPAGWTVSLKDGSTGKIAEISATPTATTNVVLDLTAVNAYGSTSPVRYFTVSILDITVPELVWTGIRCASNTVFLTWTNKTGGDTTAWIGTTTNVIAGWPTNDWIQATSPATLPAPNGPRFYLLRP